MVYLAHQLKGAGGSYGFEVISTEAAAIESALERAGGGPSADELDRLGQRIDHLQTVIKQRADEVASRIAPNAH
jgi:HPt (histidine-containing phosphotransfer) domain-containing protein